MVVFVQVEHVIKEQNMLDAFIMMEGYCNLLTGRVHLIEQDKLVSSFLFLLFLYTFTWKFQFSLYLYLMGFCSFGSRVCPDELKEAISTLLYAASRCGEFPELQEIRALFTSRYGKEFVGRAIELRNNCGVNAKV